MRSPHCSSLAGSGSRRTTRRDTAIPRWPRTGAAGASVDEDGVVLGLRRDLDRDGLHRPVADDAARVRRALGDDDQRAGLELPALVAQPNAAAALDDVL